MISILPVEHNGQRVLLTQQLAESFGTESQVIVNNFNRNKDRYKLGKHYTLLQGNDLRKFRAKNQFDLAPNLNVLYLWPEKGAWLHAKSLNTDKAWEAYEMLVDDYYNIKENTIPKTYAEALRLAANQADLIEKQKSELLEAKPKVEFFDAVADSKDAIDIGTAAKVLKINGIGRNNLFDILRGNGILMANNQPFQRYVDIGYFRVIEQKYTKPDGSTNINIKTLVYQKGLDFIRKILTPSKGIIKEGE